MPTNQKEETLSYFNANAENWKEKASVNSERKVNVIQQRNGYVLQVIEGRTATRSALDVGCGTGDLACDIAARGIPTVGVDFAPEMIEQAKVMAQQKGLPQAAFHCSSIFDYETKGQTFDVISANGFIEYITLKDLDKFMDWSYKTLAAKGSLVLGSRNRLFNLTSLNSFTLQELKDGHLELLAKEAVALADGTDLEQLTRMKCAPLQKAETKHSHTGIGVTTRYQFTPVQLMKKLARRGFQIKQLYPIHIHGVSPVFKKAHLNIHRSIADLLQQHASENRDLITHASSFMVHAQKA